METDRRPPPTVVDCARVMSYAFVDDIPYKKCGALWVGENLIEHVPRLAICLNLGEDIGPMLFHCDTEWNVLGVSGRPTILETKELAEQNYPGVGSRWVDLNTPVEEALGFYDAQTRGGRCSFCGKRPFELEGNWIAGDDAIICRGCIERYHSALHSGD